MRTHYNVFWICTRVKKYFWQLKLFFLTIFLIYFCFFWMWGRQVPVIKRYCIGKVSFKGMNGKMGLIEIKYWCADVSCSKRNNNMFVKQKIILFKTQNNLKINIFRYSFQNMMHGKTNLSKRKITNINLVRRLRCDNSSICIPGFY